MSTGKRKPAAAGKTTPGGKRRQVAKAPGTVTVPYHRKPEALSHEAWQTALRRQFVPESAFSIRPLGGHHPIFRDYAVRNPVTGRSYKVALRDGGEGGMNFCECLDFRTNRLGTCKHLEAVLAHASRKRGAKKALKDGFLPPYSSVYLRYGEERQVRVRIGTEGSGELSALAAEFFDSSGLLLPEARGRFEVFLERATRLDGDFRCYDDALAFVLAGREADRRKAVIDTAYASPGSLDGLLKTRLYPYQRRGILFAARAGRSLLADEMGLGKTIQAMGAALILKKETGIERVLVVCPTSLKYQWRSEIMRFTDESVSVIEGPYLARGKQYREESFFKIVSYHALARDLEAIGRMEPELVILDEAQRIKNWKTKLARSVKRIESPYALVLTGTPLENNLEELYSIVEFVDHFRLGPFWRFLAEHQIRDETGKITGYRGLNEIAGLLSEMTLRRRKKEVLEDLPERIDKRIFVPMTAEQRNVHEDCAYSVGRLTKKWRHRGFLTEQERQQLLILLSQMRMSCDSTFILDQDLENRHDTKVDELMGILEECLADPEQKVVVFSQWERMTRLVALALDGRGIGYRSLHGGVPGKDRKELFDTFNADPDCRVFLSTDAGSTGLNLQSASILVNLDIPWNPAVREQRIGRIHRIGQKRSITVLDFVSIDTIESRMLDLLAFKSDLARGILDSGEDTIFMGEDRYRRFMNVVGEVVPDAGTTPAAITGSAEDEGEAAELAGGAGTALEEAEEPGGESPGEDIETPELAGEAAELAVEAEAGSPPPSTPAEPPPGELFPLEPSLPGAASLPGSAVPAGTPQAHGGGASAPAEPGELMSRGISFLADLSRTLAEPGGAERLVDALAETDPDTGETWLRIPVESPQAAAGALTAIAGLFAALSGGAGRQR